MNYPDAITEGVLRQRWFSGESSKSPPAFAVAAFVWRGGFGKIECWCFVRDSGQMRLATVNKTMHCQKGRLRAVITEAAAALTGTVLGLCKPPV